VFAPGETVYLRHFQRYSISGLFPMTVVHDKPDGILLWGAAGRTHWHTNMPDGRTLPQTPLAEWSAAARVPAPRPQRHHLLSWHPAGADYSVRWFFHPDGTFRAWYANLEEPAVRWRDPVGTAGLDTVDWDLDVWVDPDRSWRWKDEELFAARLAEPEHYWVDDEARVRQAGREVVALVEAGAFPFDGTWCDFRPEVTWTEPPPTLPPGWNRPRATA
jgi:hypothetical protein